MYKNVHRIFTNHGPKLGTTQMSINRWIDKQNKVYPGSSLVVQWLRCHTFTAKVPGSILGQGTRIPQAMWCSQKKKKKKCTSIQWDTTQQQKELNDQSMQQHKNTEWFYFYEVLKLGQLAKCEKPEQQLLLGEGMGLKVRDTREFYGVIITDNIYNTLCLATGVGYMGVCIC